VVSFILFLTIIVRKLDVATYIILATTDLIIQ
jgi:hypothetical protein